MLAAQSPVLDLVSRIKEEIKGRHPNESFGGVTVASIAHVIQAVEDFEAATPAPESPAPALGIVVFKDGSWKEVRKGSEWEYENDPDYLATIPGIHGASVQITAHAAQVPYPNHWAARNPGMADHFRGEAIAAREALGLGDEKSDDVSPNDITEAIAKLKAPAQGSDIGTGSETSPEPAALLTLMRKLEWPEGTYYRDYGDLTCLICDSTQWEGLAAKVHKEGCQLAAMISALLAKPGEASEPEQIPTPHPVAEAEQSSPSPTEIDLFNKWFRSVPYEASPTLSAIKGWMARAALAEASPNGNGGAE